MCGLVLNLWLTAVLNQIDLPLPVPLHLHIQPDWRLLSYLIAVAVGSVLLAGVVPALTATRVDAQGALKQEERQVGRSIWNLRSALVTAQAALSTVLLITGTLFLHSLPRATTTDPGIDVKHTVWAHMRVVPGKYPTDERQRVLFRLCLERLEGLKGVRSASITQVVPFNDNTDHGTILRPDSGSPVHVWFRFNTVAPEYFRTIGIPIVAGREFTWHDGPGAPKVVIVNQALAALLFGKTNPVGHTINQWNGPCRIVGVARDSKYFTLSENHEPAMYGVYLQDSHGVNLHFLVRTDEGPSQIVRPVRQALSDIDPTAAIETKPMSQAMGLALLPSQAGAASWVRAAATWSPSLYVTAWSR